MQAFAGQRPDQVRSVDHPAPTVESAVDDRKSPAARRLRKENSRCEKTPHEREPTDARTRPRAVQSRALLPRRECAARPDTPALTVVGDDDAQRWTHGELDLTRCAVSPPALQSLGLPAGARVMIRMGNEANAALAYFAAIAAGYVALLASSQLTFEEAEFLRDDCGASALVLGASFENEPHGGDGLHVLRGADLARLPRARRSRTMSTPPPTIPLISFTPPARRAGRKACCMRIAPPGPRRSGIALDGA